ncbi:MAG: hypothetical protein JSV19_05990 [Phycisphaerales bacterium]|nr:MAG: hypothetical protein JSV19_05990 [Phycisphaerales bacterium]
MKVAIASVAVLCMAVVASGQVVYELAMDQQITGAGGDTIQNFNSFEPDPDGLGGFTRKLLTQGYYYGPDVYPENHIGTVLDLGAPSTLYRIEFDVRVYNDPIFNTNPYGDANCFVYFRDTSNYYYGLTMLYQTNCEWGPCDPQYPAWFHVDHVIDFTQPGEWPYNVEFDASQINRIRFRGTDWYTTLPETDWKDVRNLVITAIPVGGCCLPDGCAVTSEDDCIAGGGTYLGDGTDCGEALGACCFCEAGVSTCIDTSEACCALAGGSFQGMGTQCGYILYSEGPGGAFEDISETGTPLALGDDAGIVVPIGFTFNYYGSDKTEIGVISNGYLTFGGNMGGWPLDEPNSIWVLACDLDPTAGGMVQHQTLGAEPNRRFIVQWTGVPEWGPVGANTAQAVLYEATGCIELRYGTFTAVSYLAGVANEDGSVVTDVTASVAPDASIELCAGMAADPCPLCAALDIKPGSCPNSFNRKSRGVLHAAVCGSDSFDPAMVDIASLRLSRADGIGGEVAPHEGPPGPHTFLYDAATPYYGESCHELEGDSIIDLLMYFQSEVVTPVLELGTLPPGALVELVVSGTLLDGTPFTTAGDWIRLVPPGTPPGLVAVSSTIPDVWIDAYPLDLQLDDGGFADFQRSYPQTSVITLTAPRMAEGVRFARWEVDGEPQARGQTTIDFEVVGEAMEAKAVFLNPGVQVIQGAPAQPIEMQPIGGMTQP